MFVMTLLTDDSDKVVELLGIRSRVRNQLYLLTIVFNTSHTCLNHCIVVY